MHLAQHSLLLAAPRLSLLVEELLGNTTVEFIHVHGFDPCLHLVVPGLQPFDGLFAGGSLRPIRLEHNIAKPIEYRLRDNELLQNIGELAGEDFLARVRLWAFASVAGTVVVHVSALLDFAHKRASAVATMHQTRVGEFMLYLPRFVLGTRIQQLLDPLPTLAGHERLVRALVHGAVPFELPHVQAVAQNPVD
ncbi:MAG TPA: hypothetical protein VLE22_22975 [Bryobacteraceae bacterium]|nr:hypothetical protein [Bryobacteraceae bacterium]